MLVVFLMDYRGKLTQEQFFQAGDVAEFSPEVAAQLIADGRATDMVGRADDDLALGEEGVLIGDGDGEALPPITDPAEERVAPTRRTKKG